MIRRFNFVLVALFSAASLASAQVHVSQGAKKPSAPKVTAPASVAAQPLAISGVSSSARHCLATAGAHAHYLGWVSERSRVTVSFSADFDPVASATIMRLGEWAPDGLSEGLDAADDDSGGGFNPLIDFQAPVGGQLILFVTPWAKAGPGGCYFYKVEISTP